MNRILPSILLLLSLSASAQQDSLPPPINIETLETNDGSLTRVENQPQFPGGDQALVDYMIANLNYPDGMRQAGVGGTVQVAFTIAPTGELVNVLVHRGISGGEALNEEALRVVRAMPRWEPAKVKGVAIPMDYILPVKFEVAK
jgi:TonB family protein